MASRMESTGKEGKIQCTEALYLEMRDQFRFTPRGSVYVKGKGNMNTYFLEGLRLLPTAKKTATPTVSWRRRAESNE